MKDLDAVTRAARAGCEIHGKSHQRIVAREKDRSFWRGYWYGVAVVIVTEIIRPML